MLNITAVDDGRRPGFYEALRHLLLMGAIFYSTYGLANWLAAARAPDAAVERSGKVGVDPLQRPCRP